MHWLVIALALAGCAKKKDGPVAPPADATVVAPPPDAAPPVRPLPAATDGPAFAGSTKGGLLRLDNDGWKPIGVGGASSIVEGADGTPIGVGTSVWRIVGDQATEVAGVLSPEYVVGDKNGTLWAFKDGLHRAESTTFEKQPFPGDDPPRGLAIAATGEIWVHTIDRTHVLEGRTWKPVSIPDVTGKEADIHRLVSHPRGDLYALTTVGLFRWSGKAWARIETPPTKNQQHLTGMAQNFSHVEFIAGPAGRFAIRRFTADGIELGDDHGLGEVLPMKQQARLHAYDARGRLWITVEHSLLVLQGTKTVAQWRREELELSGDVFVIGGGPTIGAGEKAIGTVTGKVEGSAANIQILACASGKNASDYSYRSEPCEGDNTARRTTTTAGGRFTMAGVELFDMTFFVRRGDRWRSTKPVECCRKLPPGGKLDIGVLQLD